MQTESAALDHMFHALADPARRSMLDRLIKGSATVSDLAKPLAMSLPAVVQHLQVLELSGLVRSEKSGRVRTCTVDADVLARAEAWLTSRRVFWNTQFDRLGEFLAEDSKKRKRRKK